jgi:hypothetical protein
MRKLGIALLVLFCFLISGCPNMPDESKITDIDDRPTFVIDSYSNSFGQTFTSFQKDSLFFGSSDKILLGSYKNISSEVLLAFLILLPDSIEEQLTNDEAVLKSSWIEMYPNYWIGDRNNFSFSVHNINTHWNPIELNQDTINDIHASLGPNILDLVNYTLADTVIKFSIDNELVENWVRRSFDETYPEGNGILLAPLSNTGIAGFQALSSFPLYSYPILHLEFEKEGEFIDTVLAVPKIDIHIPTGERLPDPNNDVLLQSSIGVRGKLKINLEKVPRNIIIEKAILELFVDEANTFEGTIKTDTVTVNYLNKYEDVTINESYENCFLVKQQNKYSGEIKQFVQRWIDGQPNEGMEVKLSDESRSAGAISFYNSTHPDESLRPRLTIYYASDE